VDFEKFGIFEVGFRILERKRESSPRRNEVHEVFIICREELKGWKL
jgi:hypothetical protein